MTIIISLAIGGVVGYALRSFIAYAERQAARPGRLVDIYGHTYVHVGNCPKCNRQK